MHLIRQHTFDIDCSSKKFGKEIHSHLGTLLEQHFYPKLEGLLNAYAPEGYTWSIEALELQLPNISHKSWKKELVEQSLQQMEQYLLANMPFVQESFEIKDTKANTVIKDEAQAELIFFKFLKKGALPENSISANLEDILAKIEITPEFIALLVDKFTKDRIYLIRWLLGMPNAFKHRVTANSNLSENFTPAFNEILKEALKKISDSDSYTKSKITTEWIELLQWIKVLQAKSSQSQLTREVIRLSKEHWQIAIDELNYILSHAVAYCTSKSSKVDEKVKIFFKELSIGIKLVEESIQNKENNLPDTIEEIQKTETSLFKDVQFIENAGLILLHPFLQSLFEQLGLSENNVWKNDNSVHKAVLLTQYLVTGQKSIYENELILNKLLCGLEQDTIINTKLRVSKKEIEKCESLLEAVLEYWKPMNGSSAETLRETFLRRNGKLDLTGGSTELWIEERGYDILLAQLPWGISMIKTPWMEQYLTCNWT